MWTWLHDNSQSIQAIASIASIFLTVIAILVTWWYVSLTNAISQTAQMQFQLSQRQMQLTHRQFQAAYMPTLHMLMRFSRDNPSLIGYRVVNIGAREVQIQSAKLSLTTDLGYWETVLEEYQGGILTPSDMPDSRSDFGIYFTSVDKSVMPKLNSETDKQKLWEGVAITVVTSDPAGLVRYECIRKPNEPYVIRVLEEQEPEFAIPRSGFLDFLKEVLRTVDRWTDWEHP